MRLGRALACGVNRSVFSRKNYFYPDQPKDYQVTQYDLPTNEHGHLDLPSGLRVGITRAHIEEDTGKLNHVGGGGRVHDARSEEHTSELQSLMRISYAVFCLKKNRKKIKRKRP